MTKAIKLPERNYHTDRPAQRAYRAWLTVYTSRQRHYQGKRLAYACNPRRNSPGDAPVHLRNAR